MIAIDADNQALQSRCWRNGHRDLAADGLLQRGKQAGIGIAHRYNDCSGATASDRKHAQLTRELGRNQLRGCGIAFRQMAGEDARYSPLFAKGARAVVKLDRST